jgi:hypothetical protein
LITAGEFHPASVSSSLDFPTCGLLIAGAARDTAPFQRLDKTHHEDIRIKKSPITMQITLKKLMKILSDLAALGAAYAILGFYLAILIHVMLYL